MELAKIIFCKSGGVQFRPWHRRESSDCFVITPEYYENIDIWYHEFNEEAIWYTLRDIINLPKNYLNSGAIILSLPDGKNETQVPSHVIVSLQDLSYFKGHLINPDSYAKMLNWRNKIYVCARPRVFI